MKHRNLKIKVTSTELKHFPTESLVVDQYWMDLYNGYKHKKN